jgi:hypothetical protein
MSGVIPPLPNTLSWSGAQFKKSTGAIATISPLIDIHRRHRLYILYRTKKLTANLSSPIVFRIASVRRYREPRSKIIRLHIFWTHYETIRKRNSRTLSVFFFS